MPQMPPIAIKSTLSDPPSPPTPHLPYPAPAFGRTISPNILHINQIPPNISNSALAQLFPQSGNILTIKILPNKFNKPFNYAFVHFDSHAAAENSRLALSGKLINGSPLSVNWAFQCQQGTSNSLFIGDLAPEISDIVLYKAFSGFHSLVGAHVMWDMQTGKSRGYGFVRFSERNSAERALHVMQGVRLGSRAIRCNWAVRGSGVVGYKRDSEISEVIPEVKAGVIPEVSSEMAIGTTERELKAVYPIYRDSASLNTTINSFFPASASDFPFHMFRPNYEFVLRQSPKWQTTVYLGNLNPFTSQTNLWQLIQNFGWIINFRHLPERGCAFVQYDTHERAALAIVQLSGYPVDGRVLKCWWGKKRQNVAQNVAQNVGF